MITLCVVVFNFYRKLKVFVLPLLRGYLQPDLSFDLIS